jgi:hypothetical protein
VSRLVGDELEKHEAKLARFEHPTAPAASAPAVASVDVEMEWPPIALPAPSTTHCEQAFGNVDLNSAPRAAAMMAM